MVEKFACQQAPSVFSTLNGLTWKTSFTVKLTAENYSTTSNKGEMIIMKQFYLLVITLKGLNDIGAVSQQTKQPVNALRWVQ